MELVVPGPGESTRLQPGVALPRAALRDQVLLQRGERRGQGAAVTVGSQPHVDPKDVAVGREVVEGGDHPAAQAVEKFAIGEPARTGGLAFPGIGEDQVDVGRHVELPAAQLAHADDDQRLGCAVGAAGLAVRRHQVRVVQRQRGAERDLGQPGHRGADFGQVGASGEVAREGVQQHAAAKPAQGGIEGGAVAGGDPRGELRFGGGPDIGRVQRGGKLARGMRMGGQRRSRVAAERKGSGKIHRLAGRDSAGSPVGGSGRAITGDASDRPDAAAGMR